MAELLRKVEIREGGLPRLGRVGRDGEPGVTGGMLVLPPQSREVCRQFPVETHLRPHSFRLGLVVHQASPADLDLAFLPARRGGRLAFASEAGVPRGGRPVV